MNGWEQALEVVNGCVAAGVDEFVVCAGARNAALVEVLARGEAAGVLRMWRHFEERSAGFFALGRTMATGKACAVVTTSGTAAAELLPAVIEAFYQARPLTGLTADRPAAFRHSGAPQAIVQPGLFGGYAATDLTAWNGHGPLHLNIELPESFEPPRETTVFSNPGTFHPTKARPSVAALARWLRDDLYRGVVVLLGGLEPDEQEEVYHFCQTYEAPVVADATSGLREALQALAIHDADRVLKNKPPGKILRLGDVPCGRIWRDLETLADVSVWSVCRNGLPGLARNCDVTRGALHHVLPALGDIEPAGDAMDWLVGASARVARTDELLESYPDSEPALLRTLSHYVTLGSGVFLGNSLPVREWDLFAQWLRPMTRVRANRGANGIDGQISTWLGWSADEPSSWAVVGDLTTLYDLAAPFVLPQIQCAGRVLAVINNHGGRIFQRLPRLDALTARAADCLTNPHAADLAGFAKLWGLSHLQIRTADDFDLFSQDGPPVLLELLPDANQSNRFWDAWDKIKP